MGNFYWCKSADPIPMSDGTKGDKVLAVFVPSGVDKDPAKNEVQLFFEPLENKASAPEGYLKEQLVAEQTDKSRWITIGIPGTPNASYAHPYVTVTDADIALCLGAAGRKTELQTVRLTAHSRGYAGLINTMGQSSPPTLSAAMLAKVDRVTVFDACYESVGDTLRARKTGLPAMLDSKKELRADAIRLYAVNVANSSGFKSIDLSAKYFRAVAYLRLLRLAISDGRIKTSVPPDPSDPASKKEYADIVVPSWRLAADLPLPGGFTAVGDATKRSLQKYLADNGTELERIARYTNGLKSLLAEKGVSTYQPWNIDPHHFIPRELEREVVE